MIKKILLILALGLTACKATPIDSPREEKPKDPWAEMTFEWCATVTDNRLQQAGYQPGESPKAWADPYKETRYGIILGCAAIIYTSISPCRLEYKFGTDSAIQCINRYTTEDVEAIQYILRGKIPIKG
jgi:hypothetical protein